MIDTVQVVLLFVIVLLTALLLVLGIQVFFILREIRGSVKRVNRVLDNAETLSQNLSQPLTMLTGLFSGGSSIASIVQIVKLFTKKDKKDE